MILYTSDLHFGHSSVIRFDHRPFADVDEMDHVMIELWNGRVQPDDTVYIVGDLCYRSSHPAEWYLRQLKGHKFLVLGNHDFPILDKQTCGFQSKNVCLRRYRRTRILGRRSSAEENS